MAIEEKDRTIFLTGDTAKNFSDKMKNIDPKIMYI
jgi:hypothetical protein